MYACIQTYFHLFWGVSHYRKKEGAREGARIYLYINVCIMTYTNTHPNTRIHIYIYHTQQIYIRVYQKHYFSVKMCVRRLNDSEDHYHGVSVCVCVCV